MGNPAPRSEHNEPTPAYLALGRSGEDLAAAWYAARGYEVLARNWRCRQGELDLVAGRGGVTVFCEVKTRTSDAFGVPAEAVGPLKQARLRRLAALWFADQARSRAGSAAKPGSEGEPAGAGEPAGVGEPAGAGKPGGRRGGAVRFDVASVLAGQVEVIEEAF